MAPASSFRDEPEEQDSNHDASQKMQDEEMLVRRVQEWWQDGRGLAAVDKNPILAAIDGAIVTELIGQNGGGYHIILTAERLDGIHRRLGTGTELALEPMRKALQARGGAKAQARVVGNLLFKEARALYLQCEASGTAPSPAPPPEVTGSVMPAVPKEVRLDESWSSPRLYVCSDSYPAGALMALRSAPDQTSDLLAKLPANTEYNATGVSGDFLQVRIPIDGALTTAYALHRMGDTVLLVPASLAAATQPAAATSGVTLDEVWSTPRRYICSKDYPEGAQMAVRAGPSRESNQVATVGPGAEYFATGVCGEYLQIQLEIDGVSRTVYVLHTLGNLVLLVPAEPEPTQASLAPAPAPVASQPAARAAVAAVAAAEAATAAAAAEAATGERVAALEAKVAAQDLHILALQAEMAQLKAQLSMVAAAFQPLAAAH